LTDNLEDIADALLKDEPLKGAEEEEEGMDSPGRNMQASMESLHSQHKLTSQEEQEIEEYKKVKEQLEKDKILNYDDAIVTDERKATVKYKRIKDWRQGKSQYLMFLPALFTGKLRPNDYKMIFSILLSLALLLVMGMIICY